MNANQLAGILRAVIPALVAYLAGKGIFFDADTWNVILTSLATAGIAAWSAKVHTDSSTVTAAAAVPGVSVKVSPMASESVKAVAADPAVPNVARSA